MITVSISKISVDRVLDIVRELKKSGYVLNTDFEFYVRSPAYEYDGTNYTIHERSVDFVCMRESIASYLMLKYSALVNNHE